MIINAFFTIYVTNNMFKFIRGDQTAFRQARFFVRNEIREKVISENQYEYVFCLRPFRFHSDCLLYHGFNAESLCPVM